MKSKEEKRKAFSEWNAFLEKEYEKQEAYQRLFAKEGCLFLLKESWLLKDFSEAFEKETENFSKRLKMEWAKEAGALLFSEKWESVFFQKEREEWFKKPISVAFPENRYTKQVCRALPFAFENILYTETFEEAFERAENQEVEAVLVPITDEHGYSLPKMTGLLFDSSLKKTAFVVLEEDERKTGYLLLAKHPVLSFKDATLELILYPDTLEDAALLFELAREENMICQSPKGSDGQPFHFAFSGEERALLRLLFSANLFLKISFVGLYRIYDTAL